jgi:Tfp pilus assembly protein PilZ
VSRNSPRRRLEIDVNRPSDLLPRVYPNGKLGGLTIRGAPPANLGEFLAVTVRVKKPSRAFSFVGQLAWARRKGSKQLSESYGIDFQPEDDATVARMLAFARNEVGPEATRLEARIPVAVAIKLIHGGQERREQLADVSYGGAFVRTWNVLDVDSLVEVVVRPKRALFSVRLSGRVAWVRKLGDSPGMGIEFFDLDGSLRQRVERLIAPLTTESS